MTAEPLFVFGTLRDAALLSAVAGGAVASEPASLPDHRAAHAVSASGVVQNYPCLAPAPGARAEGLVLRPDPDQRARLDAYEALFDYVVDRVSVTLADGRALTAALYRPAPGTWTAGADWSLQRWSARHGAVAAASAREVMAILPHTPKASVLTRYPMIEAHSASARRARAEPLPQAHRRAASAADVEVVAHRRPYNHFFGVTETDLRFRRFNGTLSDTVTRAAFIMADAVTVLPYDPVRDRVMLVEQFRYGPFARGDANPWSLEPIAGRIDPTETPEEAARREALEEAGIALHGLEFVGRYYVSPGAVTEFILSYVALTDLTDDMTGIGGLDTEAEDIRSHILPFDTMMDMVATGEIANAPLIITAQWLAMNRARLRGR